jgi:RimJ/RimL family protein N-acetyltransferase
MSDTNPRNHLAATDVLRGQKVHLRLPRLSELSFIRTLWADVDTMVSVGGPVDLPEAKASDWFAQMVEPGDPSDCYCLILAREDIPVGEISFHHWNPRERTAVLNVKVLAAQRGHGYAKDALGTFLRFFFGRVHGNVMTDDVAAGNRAGQQLLASFGFVGDNSISGIRMMQMTKRMYLAKYGEPTDNDTLRPVTTHTPALRPSP